MATALLRTARHNRIADSMIIDALTRQVYADNNDVKMQHNDNETAYACDSAMSMADTPLLSEQVSSASDNPHQSTLLTDDHDTATPHI